MGGISKEVPPIVKIRSKVMRNPKIAGLILLGTIIVHFIGCSNDTQKQPSAEEGMISGLSLDAVLFSLNGKDYTHRHLCDDVNLRYRLSDHMKPAKDEAKALKMKSRISKKVLSQVIEGKLLEQFLSKYPASAASVGKVREKYISCFKAKKESPAAFLSWIDQNGLRSGFEQLAKNEAALTDYLQKNYASDLEVSDELVKKWQRKIAHEDAAADATNACLYAFATNLCLRARAGEDFAALAKAHSQSDDAAEGGDMGECDRDTFDKSEDEAWLAVSKLRDGEVSDPVSTGDGLTIFKCVRRIEKSENTEKPAVVLARICIHRALKYPAFDEQSLRAELARLGRKEATEKLLKPLQEKAEIRFPSGMKFFPRKQVDSYTKKGESK